MNKPPKFLKKYFCDVDFNNLDYHKRRVYVIKRILEYGDEKAVSWMWRHFDKDEIKRTICSGRGFTEKSANYWALVLNISKERIACLKKPLLKAAKRIWPY